MRIKHSTNNDNYNYEKIAVIVSFAIIVISVFIIIQKNSKISGLEDDKAEMSMHLSDLNSDLQSLNPSNDEFLIQEKNEAFKWLAEEKFDKVILQDYDENTIDITSNALFLEVYNELKYIDASIKCIKDRPGMDFMDIEPFYKLSFFINDDIDIIEIHDTFIKYDDNVYEANLLYELSEALMPVLSKLHSKESNIFYLINEAKLVLSNRYSKDKSNFYIEDIKKFNVTAIFIINHMEEVKELPFTSELTAEYIGYRFGEKINIYVYDYNGYDAKFVKIQYKDIIIIYEQKEKLCQDGLPSENPCLYKLWGAG